MRKRYTLRCNNPRTLHHRHHLVHALGNCSTRSFSVLRLLGGGPCSRGRCSVCIGAVVDTRHGAARGVLLARPRGIPPGEGAKKGIPAKAPHNSLSASQSGHVMGREAMGEEQTWRGYMRLHGSKSNVGLTMRLWAWSRPRWGPPVPSPLPTSEESVTQTECGTSTPPCCGGCCPGTWREEVGWLVIHPSVAHTAMASPALTRPASSPVRGVLELLVAHHALRMLLQAVDPVRASTQSATA